MRGGSARRSGLAGVSGSVDATGTASRFNRPSGLAVDRAGNVYVADTGNNTVRKVTPSGAVTTLAGLAGVSGHDDGAGALFSGPTGLALDSDANLYVADTGNSTIRKISPTGVVTTVAGLTGIAGLKNGVGGEVFFNQPEALALDASGNLYVADIGNAAIRKITPTGTVTTLSLTASPTPTPAPIPASTPTPTPTPAPTPPPASTGGGGGGGGGAPSLWLLVALAVLGGVRQLRRHPTERSER